MVPRRVAAFVRRWCRSLPMRVLYTHVRLWAFFFGFDGSERGRLAAMHQASACAYAGLACVSVSRPTLEPANSSWMNGRAWLRGHASNLMNGRVDAKVWTPGRHGRSQTARSTKQTAERGELIQPNQSCPYTDMGLALCGVWLPLTLLHLQEQLGPVHQVRKVFMSLVPYKQTMVTVFPGPCSCHVPAITHIKK